MVPKENNESWPQEQQNGSLNVWELHTANGENKLSVLTTLIKQINDNLSTRRDSVGYYLKRKKAL